MEIQTGNEGRQARGRPSANRNHIPSLVAAKPNCDLLGGLNVGRLYPLFFHSANTWSATSFCPPTTPAPVTDTPSLPWSPFFCQCFFNPSTATASAATCS